MRILLLGRKQIAKAEDIVTAFKNLKAQVDFVLLPGFHYTRQGDTYETSLGTYPSPSTRSRKAYYVKHFFCITLLLPLRFRENHYNVLFAIDWFEGVILLIYKFFFARQAKLIFYSYDFYFFNSKCSSRFLINQIDAWVAKHADEVWNVNDAIRSEREKQGTFAKVNKTVPLGITRKVDEWEPKNPKSFLFVGNFKSGHNLVKLVEIFSRLAQKDARFQLTLVGHGNLEDQIKKILKEKQVSPHNIRLRGFVAETELLEEIRRGEYAYGIALYEKTREVICVDPGKVKDYLSWGLPVLITETNAIAETIRDEQLGKIATSDDEQTITRLLEDVSLEEVRAQQENIHRYVSNHSFEKILRESLSVL